MPAFVSFSTKNKLSKSDAHVLWSLVISCMCCNECSQIAPKSLQLELMLVGATNRVGCDDAGFTGLFGMKSDCITVQHLPYAVVVHAGHKDQELIDD